MDMLDKQLTLEHYIVRKLDEMQTEKAERLKNVEPNWLTKQEAFSAFNKDIKAVMNKLFKEGKIRVHKTIHAPIQDYVEYVGEQEND